MISAMSHGPGVWPVSFGRLAPHTSQGPLKPRGGVRVHPCDDSAAAFGLVVLHNLCMPGGLHWVSVTLSPRCCSSDVLTTVYDIQCPCSTSGALVLAAVAF